MPAAAVEQTVAAAQACAGHAWCHQNLQASAHICDQEAEIRVFAHVVHVALGQLGHGPERVDGVLRGWGRGRVRCGGAQRCSPAPPGRLKQAARLLRSSCPLIPRPTCDASHSDISVVSSPTPSARSINSARHVGGRHIGSVVGWCRAARLESERQPARHGLTELKGHFRPTLHAAHL